MKPAPLPPVDEIIRIGAPSRFTAPWAGLGSGDPRPAEQKGITEHACLSN